MNSGFGFYTGSPSLSQALESVPTELLKNTRNHSAHCSPPCAYGRVTERCAVAPPPPTPLLLMSALHVG